MTIQNRFIFKVVFILSLLTIFPFPINTIPIFDFFDTWINDLYQVIIPWIGRHVLLLEEEVKMVMGGSGDTRYDYVVLFFHVSIAILGAIVWSLLEKKKEQQHLNTFLLVGLRYFLASSMFSYGFYKIFPLQFSAPSFVRLLQPYGDSSPMGLAWTFLGYSENYSFFAGMSEVLGGILLLHRRTAVLGALVVLGVMLNVFMLNMSYDIPVKIFSFQLVLMAFVIILSDAQRLLAVILWNKPTSSKSFEPYFQVSSWKYAQQLLKWSFILFFIYTNISGPLEYRTGTYGYLAPKSPLYGLYAVDTFIVNRDTLPPLLTDAERWRYLIVERPSDLLQIHSMNKDRKYYTISLDTLAQTIDLVGYRDTTDVGHFDYERTATNMLLKGTLGKDTIECKTTLFLKKDFPLMNRGFHWINEQPYNR